jgi:hypothetical protein
MQKKKKYIIIFKFLEKFDDNSLIMKEYDKIQFCNSKLNLFLYSTIIIRIINPMII